MKLATHNPKLIGERAECAFMAQALARGFAVSKPFGDSLPYDVIVDSSPLVSRGPGRLSRVQVRSSANLHCGCFAIHTARGNYISRPLTLKDADFVAAYIAPYATWYIIPVLAFTPRERICLYPHRLKGRARWESYREAWHLLHIREKP